MNPALAVSSLLARHRADVAMAFAARVNDMNPQAAEQLLNSIRDNADDLERLAAQAAEGTGELLDIRV